MASPARKPTRKKESGKEGASLSLVAPRELVTMTVGDQRFGIAVGAVQHVLNAQPITRVPLAPKEVAGSLNLRGRIVTVIDLRRRLGLEPAAPGQKFMYVVVEHKNELVSLMVDSVGDVMEVAPETFEYNPVNLELRWREVSAGICRLKEGLLVILDVGHVLNF